MGKTADHVCGDCAHTRGVHVPSLGRCLGLLQGPLCGCSVFRRADPPGPRLPRAGEPPSEAGSPCEDCGSPFGRCRCEPSWERAESYY
ncbi:hypothetical protein GCM10010347_41950 [Streptomyces cirratus]|uniref:Uncharacterized protein n=1 Tax=Streptomyces cirratus TaxID=68187 RepID=A0ABQ3EW46_9ACTN|nr:hypothetical protein GCM10010347_41950 [Streptomyces cirratus]